LCPENCQRAVEQQEIVIHLAAHVGGIGLNQVKPAHYDNLIMGAQLIHAAYQAGVEKLSVYPSAPIPSSQSAI